MRATQNIICFKLFIKTVVLCIWTQAI